MLVAGLVLVGYLAAADGLFRAAGDFLARKLPDGRALFAGSAALVVVVTAILNLDTSVAFLAPVMVQTSRRRGHDETLLLSACLLLSNAGSLLLPGSNLTNLIVLGHLRLSGSQFAARMGPAWLAASLVTAGSVAFAGRRVLRMRCESSAEPVRAPVVGLGTAAVAAVAVMVLVLASPALWVLGVGVAATAVRLWRRPRELAGVLGLLGLPVLAGLLGVAIGLGTLGRDWSGPQQLLGELGPWATAGVGAAAAVLFNNLPAASLLASRIPPHPYSLLVGLNLGPNLFVTGSLSWILWLRSSRLAGGHPSIRRTSRIGLVSVPLSMAAALGVLLLTPVRV